MYDLLEICTEPLEVVGPATAKDPVTGRLEVVSRNHHIYIGDAMYADLPRRESQGRLTSQGWDKGCHLHVSLSRDRCFN